MARNSNITKELKRIECEERLIERGEKKISSEEARIEQKEDLLRVFEELGFMRWKSYYILTAGAILLLSLTFVTAIWVVHDQIADVQSSINALNAKIDAATTAPVQNWCPEGQTITMNLGDAGNTQITIIGKELLDGKEMCRGVVTTQNQDSGAQTIDILWDQAGNLQMS